MLAYYLTERGFLRKTLTTRRTPASLPNSTHKSRKQKKPVCGVSASPSQSKQHTARNSPRIGASHVTKSSVMQRPFRLCPGKGGSPPYYSLVSISTKRYEREEEFVPTPAEPVFDRDLGPVGTWFSQLTIFFIVHACVSDILRHV